MVNSDNRWPGPRKLMDQPFGKPLAGPIALARGIREEFFRGVLTVRSIHAQSGKRRRRGACSGVVNPNVSSEGRHGVAPGEEWRALGGNSPERLSAPVICRFAGS